MVFKNWGGYVFENKIIELKIMWIWKDVLSKGL